MNLSVLPGMAFGGAGIRREPIMTGAVLLAHGTLGEALIGAVELIAGPQQQVRAVGLCHGDDVEDFEKRFLAAMREVDTGDGVVVFVDFYGGTPANVAMRCLHRSPFPCVAGVNLPMLTEALTSRDIYTTAELEDVALEAGSTGVVRLADQMGQFSAGVQNDF